MFDTSTSETGEGGPSMLFSEQVRAEIEGTGTGLRAAGEGSVDDSTDINHHDMFHIDEDRIPLAAGIIADGEPVVQLTDKIEAAQEAVDDNVDINFWLQSMEDGVAEAAATAVAGPSFVKRARPGEKWVRKGDDQLVRVKVEASDDGEKPLARGATEPETEAGPSRAKKPRISNDREQDTKPHISDEDVKPDIRAMMEVIARENTMKDIHFYEEAFAEMPSYHSGDTDDYEMDHRPWLDRAAVKRDIQSLYSISGLYNPSLGTYRYRVVDRLGEGTFSSVYLAKDLLHNVHDNTYWTGKENTKQVDELYQPSEVKVALKKILVTSSPARVENEISILENLRGCRNVSPLVSAFRDEDQIIIVLPYHQSDDFRYFYKLMDPPKIRQYMTCLLRALKDTHGRGIIHRDVKPANFLFDYGTGHGVLVDFGLAERYQPLKWPTCQHEPATRAKLHGVRTKTADTTVVEQAVYDARKRAKAGEGRVGFRQEDSRPAVKTNRAGTRGFRAPEVLLKCPDQTVAIDVWSAGVILLSLLSHKFPAFNSTDDVEALMEIAALFGRTAMERCAMLHNRTVITNVPTVDCPPEPLAATITRLNPHLYTPHQPHPTPTEAAKHIREVDGMLDLCSRLLRLDPTTRYTAAAALRHEFIGADEGPDELIDPTEGKCGHLHVLSADGHHRARFGDMTEEMRFGQGIPPSRDELCPEHEHWQQRSGVNPIGAAYGATLDEEYYHRAGFHVKEDHLAWDHMGARDEVAAS